jgi:autotransporter-associated beta strand protein
VTVPHFTFLFKSRCLSAGFLGAAAFLHGSLLAQATPPVSHTWGSITGNWSTASNWTPNSVPASSSTTIAKFTGSSAFTSTNDLGADFNLYSVVIDAGYSGSGATLAAAAADQNLLFASNDFSYGAVRMDGSGSFNLNHDLELSSGGQLTIYVNAGQLWIGNRAAPGFASGEGNINLNGGHLFIEGIGDSSSSLTIGTTGWGGGVISDGGSTPGSVSIDTAGNGLTVYFAGANTYSGGTTVKSGTLSLAGGGLGTGAVTIENHATLSGYGSAAGAVVLHSGGTLSPFWPPAIPSQPSDGYHLDPPYYSSQLVLVGYLLGSLTWDGGGHITESISPTFFVRPYINGALTKGAPGSYTIDLTDAGVSPGETYSLLAFGSQSGFSASDFTVTGLAGTLTLTATELLFTAAPTPPVYAVAVGLAKGKNRAAFTITNTGTTVTDFRLVQSHQVLGSRSGAGPVKPAFKVVTALNGANVSGAIANGTTATIAPGTSARVVVQINARADIRSRRAIRIAIAATSLVDASKSSSASVVLKTSR